MKETLYGTLEAGGTKMVLAIVNGQGELLDRISLPTGTPAETMPQMIEVGIRNGVMIPHWMASLYLSEI